MNDHIDQKPQMALKELMMGNNIYINSCKNPADISCQRKLETTKNGQNPYAVIVTCSDSRVPPEHIFSAGIGDLFVIRTAGNVVGSFELGSIEYAVQHLHVPIIVIMGHTHCGAVTAALSGHATGYLQNVVQEIQLGLHGARNENEAIGNNILHSKQRVLQSQIVGSLMETGQLALACAEYNIKTGYVNFF